MPDRLKIVRATRGHIAQLVPLFDAYRVFYGQESDPGAARSYLLDRLAQDESVIFLASDKESERPLGFTQLYPSFSSVNLRPLWILNDLYVVPSHRRQGIGRALMKTAHLFARETGAHAVTLATAVDNVHAQRLYESLGYRRDDAFYTYDLLL